MVYFVGEPRDAVVGGLPVRYYASGHPGPDARTGAAPLVLVHGLGGAGIVWHRNVPALSERFTVYVVDLFGRTRPPNGGRGLTAADGVRWLTGFLDAVGASRAHLLGGSLGGLIAGWTAVLAPERVRSLTLVSAAGLGRELAWSQRLMTLPVIGEIAIHTGPVRYRKSIRSLLGYPDAATDEFLSALFAARAWDGTAAATLAVLRAGVGLGGVRREMLLTPHLPAVRVPTLLMWGRNDPLFPSSHAERAAAAMPGATLRLFDACGHWPYLEKADEFNDALLAFLATVESGTRRA